MDTLVCARSAGYAGALTVGKSYALLERDEDKGQVRLEGDNGRTRWFPADCFDEGEVITLVSWTLDDPEVDRHLGNVEVNLSFSDGSRRWCLCLTPQNLSTLLFENGQGPVMQGRHLLVVPSLEDTAIEAALTHLEEQGLLLEASLPLGE